MQLVIHISRLAQKGLSNEHFILFCWLILPVPVTITITDGDPNSARVVLLRSVLLSATCMSGSPPFQA